MKVAATDLQGEKTSFSRANVSNVNVMDMRLLVTPSTLDVG